MARILVVDDDPDFVEIVRMILSAKGYEVETASNGAMALGMMQKCAPDLVVLDVMMSGILDGVDLAHKVDEDVKLHDVPVIMVSSIIDTPNAALFPTDEYIPIDTWISKPVQPDVLLAAVAKFLHKK
jgi:CheY-like chemotaxis protein